MCGPGSTPSTSMRAATTAACSSTESSRDDERAASTQETALSDDGGASGALLGGPGRAVLGPLLLGGLHTALVLVQDVEPLREDLFELRDAAPLEEHVPV